MAVYVSNLVINCGSYFSQEFTLYNSDGTPLNLTGYTGKSYIRKSAATSSYTEFIFTIVNEVQGKIRLTLSSDASKQLKYGRYVYDVRITSGAGLKSIVLEGGVLVRDDVTVNVTTPAAQADYFVLQYTFTNGSDLDTRTKVVNPSIPGYVGWSVGNTIGSPVFVTWGGDNTGTGVESFLFDKAAFLSSYPGTDNITFDLRCGWYGSIGTNPVTVTVTSYKGGAMVKSGYTWNNPTADETYSDFDSVSKVITATISSAATLGESVSTMNLNFTQGVITFS